MEASQNMETSNNNSRTDLIPIPKSAGNSPNPKNRKDNSGPQNYRPIVPTSKKERMINKRLICYFGNQQFNNKPSIWFPKQKNHS